MKSVKYEIFITLFIFLFSICLYKNRFEAVSAGTFSEKNKSNVTMSDLARVLESEVMTNFYKN